MAVTIGNWRFYTDDSTDAAMTPLAAENTVPTLTGQQTMSGTIRLRLQLVGDGSGGSINVSAQHGVDSSNWRTWDEASDTGERSWVRWANGASTANATVESLLLSGSTAAGKYHESDSVSESVSSNQVREIDIALQVLWWPPSVTVLQRIRDGSTTLAYESGVPNIGATACSAVERAHTIDVAGTSTSGGQSREVDFSCWPRMWHDGTYWWWLSTQPNFSSSTLYAWRWDSTGDEYGNWIKSSYSVGSTIVTSSEGDVRHAPNFRILSGGQHIAIVALRPTSGDLQYLRGTFSAGSLNWTQTSLGRGSYSSSGYPIHAAIDDGGYHWVGGFDGTSGVWACRTQTADSGGAYTPDFGSLDSRRKTVSDSVSSAIDGNPIALMGLTSDKALAVWVDGSYLRWSTVTDASGFASTTTLGSTALKSSHDWGMARSVDGAYVYLCYRDQTGASGDAGGDWVFYVYTVATNTWNRGPNAPRGAQNNNKDGITVGVDAANRVYVFGTGVGSGGNQDRPVQLCAYTGPGHTGTWDPSHVFLSPQERGNGDDIASAPVAGSDGKILAGYLWGDNDVSGHPFTFEYYAVDADSGPTNPPDTPTGVNATAVSHSRIDVTWTASSGATSYDVERDSTVISGLSSPFVDNGRTASTMYSYRVRAVNSAGTSAWSSIVSATTPVYTPPTGISRRSFSITENTSTTTDHIATKPSGAVSGDVLIVSVVLNGSSVSSVPSGWTTLYSATGAVSNPRSYAYMRVLTSADDAVTSWTWQSTSAVNSSVGCDCLEGVDPTTPLDTTVSYVESATATGSVAIPGITTATNDAWIVSAYSINSSNVSRVLTPPTGFSANVWDLAGKRQAYASQQIASAGSIGDQTWSVDSTYAAVAWMAALRPAASGGSAPDTPANLAATPATYSQIDLTWDDSAGATSYDVERDSQVISGVTSPYSDEGLSASTMYSYRVRAVNATGESAWSSIVTATTPAFNSPTVVVVDQLVGSTLVRQTIEKFDGASLVSQSIEKQ